jgi:hypothetical protein
MQIVRLVNPTYDVRHRRVAKNQGGEGGNMAHKHYVYRRPNPFAAGGINKLAVKVAGAIGGAWGASAIPSMISPSLSSGWGGVGLALVVAFGGAYLLQKMSTDLAEGVLIGGSVTAVSNAVAIVTGKQIVTIGRMGQYGPLNFTIPTPAYQQSQPAPAIPASASSTKGGAAVATQSGMMGRHRGGAYSKYVS